MMLQVGDDGVVTSVNEEELVYVDKNELEQLIENYQQLEKENEQLKHECNYLQNRLDDFINIQNENEQLKKQLDYIQNSISEHIKHQKTELGQKALQEIIEDYNEWLLGHKEAKE